MRLLLGVADIPYSDAGSDKTTFEVAEILEARYAPFEIFYRLNESQIGDWLAEAIGDQIQDLFRGTPAPRNPFFAAEQKIEAAFRKFIYSGEIENIGSRVPTKAALAGRSKRFKRSKGPRRPSLVDTTTFVQSMRAWVEK